MKILHLIPFYKDKIGGSERFAVQLANHQLKRGFKVVILACTNNKSLKGNFKEKNGLEIERVYSRFIIWNINPVAIVYNRINKINPDIIHVHSHLYFNSLQGLFYGWLKKKKIILHLHGGIGLPPYKSTTTKIVSKMVYDKFITNFAFKSSNLILSVSKKDIKNSIVKHEYIKNKIFYVPNLIDLNLFNNSDKVVFGNSPVKFVYIGDLEDWKGINILLRVIPYLLERFEIYKTINKTFEFHIIGEGSYQEQIQALKNKYPKFIHYYGQLDHKEVASKIKKMDALLFPSLWEGFPTVILEAMASGLFVITTDVADIPSLLTENENGFIVSKSTKEFYTSMDKFIRNYESYSRVIANNQNLVKQFSLDLIEKKVFNHYVSVLK